MQQKSILSMLRAGMRTFGNTETKVAEYILRQPQRVVEMSIQELAQTSRVSEASIVRFSRKIGLGGYSELKLMLATEVMMQGEVDVYQDIAIDEQPLDVLKKLSKITNKALGDTVKVIDKRAIDEAVTLIECAGQARKNLYLVASGGSQIVTQDLQFKLMRIGISSSCFANAHITFEAVASSRPDEVAFVVSSLGLSKEVLDCVRVLKQNQTKIILLTQFGNNRMIDQADVCLLTSNVENNLRLGSIATRLVHLQIVDMLFVSLALKRYDAVRQKLKTVKDAFREHEFYVT